MDQNPSSPENTAAKPTEADAENPIGSPAKQEFNGRALFKELALWFLRMPANVCFEIKQRMNIVNQAVSVVFSGVVCAMLGIAVPASALEFHVSPTGDDVAAGTVTKPFRTVQRAKAEVRKTIAAGLRNVVTVFLHGGTYELSEPLVFGPEDSGTEAFPITYAAFANEAVVLSGGRMITNWKKAEQGQWTADLPESKSGKWFFRQLVVNDRRAVRARWPDEDGGLLIATIGGELEVPHAPELEPEQLTIEAWIKFINPPNGGDSRAWIVNKNRNESAPSHYALLINGKKPMAYIGGSAAVGPELLTPNQWHHLAMSYDGDTLRLYTDGREVATTKTQAKRRSGNTSLVIGRRQDGGPKFMGCTDEVRLYNRVLRADEIKSNYKALTATPPRRPAAEGKGLVREWTFDDPADEAIGVLGSALSGIGVRSFSFNTPLPKDTLAGQGAEMVVYEHWSITRGLIAASDEKQVRTATRMGWIGHGDYTTASPGKVCYLEHARAFLDKPGEWFLDTAAGVLRYIPLEGEDPAKLVAVAPRLERLVVIAGTKERPVRNLRFRGIRFEHADFPLPAMGYNEIQAGHYGTALTEPTHVQPVGIECIYAEGCRFERCRIAHLNSAGIGFGPGCRKNAVMGCAIEDIGGNGVMVGWRGKGKLRAANQPGGALDADWGDPTDAPASNEVANCHIQRCGADSRGSVGICVAFSTDTRVAHNLIHDLPYTGISVGFRWNTTPSTQARCVVEYNHIHDVMKMLADGGGIYTLGLQPGTVLRGNLIHDVYRRACAQGAPNNGFFVDEGSSGFLFESNVVYKTSGESVRFNQNSRTSHKWTVNFFGDTDAKAEGAQATINKAGIESEYRQQ